MRTRQELEDKTADGISDGYDAKTELLSTILETLLDIRDLLSKDK